MKRDTHQDQKREERKRDGQRKKRKTESTKANKRKRKIPSVDERKDEEGHPPGPKKRGKKKTWTKKKEKD
jgi:hypothetical protein